MLSKFSLEQFPLAAISFVDALAVPGGGALDVPRGLTLHMRRQKYIRHAQGYLHHRRRSFRFVDDLIKLFLHAVSSAINDKVHEYMIPCQVNIQHHRRSI